MCISPSIRLTVPEEVSNISGFNFFKLVLYLLGGRDYMQKLRLKFVKVYFWSDLTIVLGWAKMSPSLSKQFVQNA